MTAGESLSRMIQEEMSKPQIVKHIKTPPLTLQTVRAMMTRLTEGISRESQDSIPRPKHFND